MSNIELSKTDIDNLQSIIQGQAYSEAIILKAIKVADTDEVKICLISLKSGKESLNSRMVLQDFVCRLSKASK